ncbi:MAG: M56 family metallopeptidase [bacterium]|nr:M56 family metallopeptidase [bacterium]
MTNILYNLILMNVSGTIMYLLSRLFKRQKNCIVMHYIMLASAVVIMLVPFQELLGINAFYKVGLPREFISASGYTSGSGYAAVGARSAGMGIAALTVCVWLAGAAVSLARVAVGYSRTRQLLRRITRVSYDERLLEACFSMRERLGIKRAVELRTSGSLNSPLLYGFAHTRIVIPERDFTDTELEMIMAHELTHYRHCDLWISLAAAIAACVNWFNPFVHLLCRELTQACEQCCDASVLALLEPEDRKDYGRLIISVIEDGLKSRLTCTTSMAAPKDSIQQRLMNIVRFRKPSAAVRIAGAVLISACTASSLTVFGFETAVEVLPEEVRESVREKLSEPISWSVGTAPPAEPVTSAAPSAVSLNEVPSAVPEVSLDVPSAVQEYGNERADTENTERESYELEDEIQAEETVQPNAPKIISMPSSSYLLNVKFDESNSVMSDYFRAERDLKLYVSMGTGDILLAVYDADTNEAVYDERERKLTNQSFYIPMRQGQTYYIMMFCDAPEEAKTLYVSAS